MRRSHPRLGSMLTLALIATLLPLGAVTAPAATGDPVLLNEILASTTGTDSEYIELFGTPGTSLDGLSFIEVESDDGTSNGAIDHRFDFGPDDVIDAEGFFLAANAQAVTVYGVTPDFDLPANALENSSATYALVETSSITGTSVTGSEVVLDAVAATDGETAGFFHLGAPVVGPDGSFLPAGLFRLEDGVDTDTAGDWGIADFNNGPANTPGVSNVPPPPPDPDLSLIHDVQGSGASSPVAGDAVKVQGVVVGDFQGSAGLNGFYLQEEDAEVDADPATSEGIFVHDSGLGVDVAIGDVVAVIGTAFESFGLTSINPATSIVVVPPEDQEVPATATAATVTLPVTAVGDFEKFEGMAVTIPQELYISEYFNFDRFGEIVLSTERQYQPTALFDAGTPEAAAVAAANSLGRITLDDGRGGQNPDPAIHPNGEVFDLTNRFRGGDTVTDVTGVMDFAFSLYRIQPTTGAGYEAANPRPALPDVGGRLTVAAFNVLNYFTTLDEGQDDCGPLGDQECRGADDANEFTRQRDKIISALDEIDADVVGVIEIENHPTDVALADLVQGLNDVAGTGTYEYVATGAIGPDAIRVGVIYKPDSVTPLGGAVLDSDDFLDPLSSGEAKNRPAQAQTFEENATGEVFTVVVNHLKSKGSACGAPDDDPVQGNCNATRAAAAQVLLDWLATDPTSSGDSDTLIIGDLNSYDKEDPIDVLVAGGFEDLLLEHQGEEAYSYVFDGQLGYLDYAMATGTAADQVTGTAAWHINADEPDILDYDTSFKQDAQDALYEPNPFRSSDHDPVVVGLDLDQTPPVVEAGFDGIVAGFRTGLFEVEYSCEDNVDPSPECVGELNGIPVDDGQIVYLIMAKGRPLHFELGGVLFVKAPSFELVVTGTDDAGNSATASAAPEFRSFGR